MGFKVNDEVKVVKEGLVSFGKTGKIAYRDPCKDNLFTVVLENGKAVNLSGSSLEKLPKSNSTSPSDVIFVCGYDGKMIDDLDKLDGGEWVMYRENTFEDIKEDIDELFDAWEQVIVYMDGKFFHVDRKPQLVEFQ